jgi:crotonobetainyl-CoA:carnitine CoA-transferase CaiB-like acyl-CoA transferase
MVAFNANQISGYLVSGNIPKRYGNAHANVVPYQVFPCKDGHIILAIGNDTQFASFCKVTGRPELAEDERYRLMSGRIVNRDTLIPLIAETMKQRGMREWIDALEAANVPCGPINNMQQVLEDPQVQHRGMKVEIPTESGVPCPGVASPMRFSETPVEYTVPPPKLGQHTQEILRGILGMDQQAVDALVAKGIV